MSGRPDPRGGGSPPAGADPGGGRPEARAEPAAWVDQAVVPLASLLAALALSALIVAGLGESPLAAMASLARGAFGYGEGLGFTLFYATNFIFTGLAVAVAFHAGLFNIGGEGQAYLGGLGTALVCLGLGGWPLWVVLPLALLAAALFGAGWALVPAWLQARRGSHVVITTIMFNFIASSLMTYLLVDVLIAPGQPSPQTRGFDPSTHLPFLHEALGRVGVAVSPSPLNVSFLLALLCCALFWGLVWHTRWGYEVRAAGHNPTAARYAGIPLAWTTVSALCLGGAFAGLVAVNELMGVQHRLLLHFTAGYGFVGIAVSLMGRNHPIGIVLAAVLFGALYQGGSELAFDVPAITREIVVVIQGLVILFCGALEGLFRPHVERLFRRHPDGGVRRGAA